MYASKFAYVFNGTMLNVATLTLGFRRCGPNVKEFHVPESVGECEGMNPHTPK
jgi:hypothetical protein